MSCWDRDTTGHSQCRRGESNTRNEIDQLRRQGDGCGRAGFRIPIATKSAMTLRDASVGAHVKFHVFVYPLKAIR